MIYTSAAPGVDDVYPGAKITKTKKVTGGSAMALINERQNCFRESGTMVIGNKPKRRCRKRVGAILNNGPASSSCPSLIFIRHVYMYIWELE